MRYHRERLKAKLLEQAEAEIEALLDWHEQTHQPNLSQIEQKVLEIRQRLSEQMALGLIESQASRRPVPGPACPQCGYEMRYKGQKHKQLETWVGHVDLERGYYHCSACQEGLFPPGPTTGVE
jgi:hypothetical protein